MTDVSSKATILILAFAEPANDLFCFFGGERMLHGRESGEGPVRACDLQMLSEVFADREEIFAVLESQQIVEMLVPIKFDGLTLHCDYYRCVGQ